MSSAFTTFSLDNPPSLRNPGFFRFDPSSPFFMYVSLTVALDYLSRTLVRPSPPFPLPPLVRRFFSTFFRSLTLLLVFLAGMPVSHLRCINAELMGYFLFFLFPKPPCPNSAPFFSPPCLSPHFASRAGFMAMLNFEETPPTLLHYSQPP